MDYSDMIMSMSIWEKIADSGIYRLPKKPTKRAAWKEKLKDPDVIKRSKDVKAKIDKTITISGHIANYKRKLTLTERKCSKALRKVYDYKTCKCQHGFRFKKNDFCIVDFYFPRYKLVVVINTIVSDLHRKRLFKRGIKLLNFTNEQILDNIKNILDIIADEIAISRGGNSRANKAVST